MEHYESMALSASRKPRPKRLASFRCEQCGGAFTAYALKQPRPRYCSKLCGQRAWRSANMEREREHSRTSRKRHLPKRVAYNREWRAKNPQMACEQSRRWRQRNPEKAAELARRRQTCRREQTPKWHDPAIAVEFYREARRLTRETGIQHHVDHIIPLRGELVCGLHVHNNLQVLPASVNVAKKNRFVEDQVRGWL